MNQEEKIKLFKDYKLIIMIYRDKQHNLKKNKCNKQHKYRQIMRLKKMNQKRL